MALSTLSLHWDETRRHFSNSLVLLEDAYSYCFSIMNLYFHIKFQVTEMEMEFYTRDLICKFVKLLCMVSDISFCDLWLVVLYSCPIKVINRTNNNKYFRLTQENVTQIMWQYSTRNSVVNQRDENIPKSNFYIKLSCNQSLAFMMFNNLLLIYLL